MMVIDASVAAKWFLPEEGSETAKAILQQGKSLIAPPLIRIEVAAAITKAARIGKLSPETSYLLCERWLLRLTQGIVRLEDNPKDYREAAHLAAALSHPYQDCLYLAMAARHAVPLLSADKVQASKAAIANITSLPFQAGSFSTF